jgi:hypothetical protein
MNEDKVIKRGHYSRAKRYGYIVVGTAVATASTVWFEGVAHAGNSLRRILGNSL